MSLFWKIFLSFGIAMSVTLVGAILISFHLASDVFDQINIEGRDRIVEQAADALARGGEPELTRWLQRNTQPLPSMALFVLDQNGRELLDRVLPRDLQRLLRRRNDGDRDGDRDRDGESTAERTPVPAGDRENTGRRDNDRDRERPNIRLAQLTSHLIGGDGTEYRMLFGRVHVTFLGIMTWPGTQIAVPTIAVIVGALTSLLLASYLAAPITRLQRASRALAAGAFDTRVGSPSTSRRDEVGRLARDFDTMAERIQTLVTDKETLLRDVSHELRSPLARIRVAVALAERHASELIQSDLQRIEQECERLDDLVGQIVTLTRLGAQAPVTLDALRFDELVTEIVEDARFEHANRQIDFTAHSFREIHGNARWLRSAVENVVRNALAYSAPEQPISLTLEDDGDYVVLRVEDSGPGVPEAALTRIFEPFYRADESRDQRLSGYGIGLAITSRVIALHKGSVAARNRAAGGLEVVLRLPAAEPQRL